MHIAEEVAKHPVVPNHRVEHDPQCGVARVAGEDFHRELRNGHRAQQHQHQIEHHGVHQRVLGLERMNGAEWDAAGNVATACENTKHHVQSKGAVDDAANDGHVDGDDVGVSHHNAQQPNVE